MRADKLTLKHLTISFAATECQAQQTRKCELTMTSFVEIMILFRMMILSCSSRSDRDA